ncbi:methyl-accepting chemotaxis protein [Syntrophotalea acetylenica]|jgi:methyl-accepting chemotaxis protein|uniref:Chemotaxis protein n=1 Tax=Syntrophotalea acetylenica TaxID=29542 RepID=A0A1L3GFG8_SYNAC|nr:methyl-accepting chemotaxis protein [Syntrophotalea acetylenica]APG24706.1 chemotaxis protein [Syntrophotalea acetylenica]APG42762.1 chemotaxis protein [Syntrophotalea acetylenica]MDY0261746.1 methyl-accepting chemotaxis protein [Syntrophotalea acetylenica]
MRVEITYKFIMGFIIVVASIVALNYLVPAAGLVPHYMEQALSTACALLVGLLLGWIFSKAFTANILVLKTAAGRISGGDLSQTVCLPSNLLPDETAELAESLNLVTVNLRELVGYIRSSSLRVAEEAQGLAAMSQQVMASAHEVNGAVEMISRGAETQSAMVEQASDHFRHMTLTVEQVADAARAAAGAANETMHTAERGGQVVNVAMGKLGQVFDGVEQHGQQMLSFSARVQKIGKVADLITGLSQKTNLLALNASIEAARAGEHGRGFTVVAEEICKLADSSERAMADIMAMIEVLQDESVRIQADLKEHVADMGAGRSAVRRTGQAFEEIVTTAKLAGERAEAISMLSRKQVEEVGKTADVVEEIARVVTENAAASEEASAASEQQSAAMENLALSARSLHALAEDLQGRVSRFQLGLSREQE